MYTDTEYNNEGIMDDEDSFTWPVDYHDSALDEHHRSKDHASLQEQELEQDQI